MTYEKFFKKIELLYKKSEKQQYTTYVYWEDGWDETKYTVYWCIGGRDGGNCWGNNYSYSIDAEEEPEIGIDELLEQVCPNITYLQYKKIIKDVVHKEQKEIREYYGNYRIVKYKIIIYRDLYDALVKYKVI